MDVNRYPQLPVSYLSAPRSRHEREFGVVALLLGFGIGVMISGGLPDIIRTLADLGAAARGAVAH
jgi:hypothetical protein